VAKSSFYPWKTSFLGAFVATSLVVNLLFPSQLDLADGPPIDWGGTTLAGLLVGFGTRLGNGCTSGHGMFFPVLRRGMTACAQVFPYS
jgi:hypothetical protein